jgi:hypothetical protein
MQAETNGDLHPEAEVKVEGDPPQFTYVHRKVQN